MRVPSPGTAGYYSPYQYSICFASGNLNPESLSMKACQQQGPVQEIPLQRDQCLHWQCLAPPMASLALRRVFSVLQLGSVLFRNLALDITSHDCYGRAGVHEELNGHSVDCSSYMVLRQRTEGKSVNGVVVFCVVGRGLYLLSPFFFTLGSGAHCCKGWSFSCCCSCWSLAAHPLAKWPSIPHFLRIIGPTACVSFPRGNLLLALVIA